MKRTIFSLILCVSAAFGQSSFTMRVQSNGTTVKTAASYLVLNFSTNLTATSSGNTVSVSVSGLGSAAALNTGTSGATIPLLNTANTWSNAQTLATWTAVGASAVTLSVAAPTGATANYAAVFTGGNVGIGTTAPQGKLDVVQTAIANTASFTNTQGGAIGSGIIGYTDDGAATGNGDRLGYFLLGGARDNAHTMGNAVGIVGYADENWSGTANGGRLEFQVTPNTTITRSTAMTILNTGNVGIGTTSPVSKLSILLAAVATANYGTISLGAGPFDGTTAGKFVGSANGTQFAINAASGSTSDLAMWQVAGVTQFQVSAAGVMTLGGSTFVLGGHTCSIVSTVLTCP